MNGALVTKTTDLIAALFDQAAVPQFGISLWGSQFDITSLQKNERRSHLPHVRKREEGGNHTKLC